MPPQQTTRSIGHAVLAHPLDDGARAEGRRLDERAVDLGPRRVERLADEEAGEPRVDQDRAVAVVPVERHEARLAGPRARAASAESSRVQRVVALADDLDPPVQDVAHRRLPGLDAVVAGHDRAVHDAADAGHVRSGSRRRRRRRSRRWTCR